MKYLWLIFILCVVALAAQIHFSPPAEDPFADGRLACLPLPPEIKRADPVLLPAPVIEKIPPPTLAPRVQATSIEIFNPIASTGLMVETRHADNADWGLPRSLPGDGPIELAYAPEPKLVAPVPVNVPPPPPPPPPALEDIITTGGTAWSRTLTRWQPEEQVLAAMYARDSPMETFADLPPLTPSDVPIPVPAPAETAATSAPRPTFYPVPGKEPLETASLDPSRLVSSKPKKFQPNLYLPDGATDEEGAKLTLISPELHMYELPDTSSAAAPVTLKSGDQVRPLTRLKNAAGFDWIKFEHGEKSWWAQAEYFIRVDPRNRRWSAQGNLDVGTEKVDKDSALPMDYHPSDLKDVAGHFTFGAKNVKLRKEAAEAFEEMAKAAEKEGLQIRVFSGFRDFAYQKNLYLKAITSDGPKQDGTAAPGYSEHQLGTTVDICNENRRTILQGTFGDTPEGRWLDANSEKYGFRKSYTSENSKEVGYKPEPWHFRFIGKAAASPGKGQGAIASK